MKTAYKDLKTKLSDRTPPKGGAASSTSRGHASTMAGTTATMYQHHSAPNSPVFTKRPQTELFTINSNSSQHQRKPSSHSMLQTSNSMMNNATSATNTTNLTNHINNNLNHNNNNNSSNSYSNSGNSNSHINLSTINKTPTRTTPSPTSSNSSSEMNLLQELQQHALFKSPAVDRSVSVFGCASLRSFYSFVFNVHPHAACKCSALSTQPRVRLRQ